MRRTLKNATPILAALAAVALLTASGPAGAAPAATAPPQDEFTWDGTLAAGRTLEIKSANGKIHAEAASGNRIEVRAVKEGPADDRAEVTIEVVEHEGGVTICAMYPSGWLRRDYECGPDDDNYGARGNETTVDFEVRVPAGVHFKGETMNGEVVAEDIGANVIAHSMNGAIRVTATGHVDASTMNGAVTVAMGRTDWSGTLEIGSMNGRIRVELPEDASTEVEAETMNGGIKSDWDSVEVETHRWVGRSASGTIGNGGRRLVLESMNGAIEILRGN